MRADFSYFSTKANYGQDGGTASDLPFGASLESMMIEGLFLFDWRPDWRFGAGANYAFVETDDGNFARSNSGANEFLMHAQKWFELGPLDIVPQVDFAYPFFRVDENADDAVYGEGAMRTALGSWIFYPLRGLKPFAFVGAQHRDEGRSLIVPYAAGVRFQSGGWWFLGEARGY
ncbi:MAG TPA: hypothetical protein PKC28_01580, partial [Bdellovibrionales bacterium]|nr:hypothetical protein [Bdellovibrionales bacterium]